MRTTCFNSSDEGVGVPNPSLYADSLLPYTDSPPLDADPLPLLGANPPPLLYADPPPLDADPLPLDADPPAGCRPLPPDANSPSRHVICDKCGDANSYPHCGQTNTCENITIGIRPRWGVLCNGNERIEWAICLIIITDKPIISID